MMTLGYGVPQDARVPFQRPAAAGNYTPRAITTEYKTHINPFWRIMPPLTTRSYRPELPAAAQPGAVHPLTPIAAAAAEAAATGTGPTLGRRSGGGLNPYRIMRVGLFPSVASNATGLEHMAQRQAGKIPRLLPNTPR